MSALTRFRLCYPGAEWVPSIRTLVSCGSARVPTSRKCPPNARSQRKRFRPPADRKIIPARVMMTCGVGGPLDRFRPQTERNRSARRAYGETGYWRWRAELRTWGVR